MTLTFDGSNVSMLSRIRLTRKTGAFYTKGPRVARKIAELDEMAQGPLTFL